MADVLIELAVLELQVPRIPQTRLRRLGVGNQTRAPAAIGIDGEGQHDNGCHERHHDFDPHRPSIRAPGSGVNITGARATVVTCRGTRAHGIRAFS